MAEQRQYDTTGLVVYSATKELRAQDGLMYFERALERQLTRRFAPLSAQVCARLANTPLEQLGQWADNILDAKSLEGVFTNH